MLALVLAVLVCLWGGCRSTHGGSGPPGAGAPATELLNQQLAASIPLSPDAGEELRGDYRVGPGDVLEISVFQAEDLTLTVRVRPDGTISYPLLGSLRVAGETTGDLEIALARRLGETYLNEPQVSVFVRDYRAHPVAVLGEVNKPGVYYLSESRSVLGMLSEAGGLTKDAAPELQIRRKQEQDPGLTQLTINLEKLLVEHERGLDLEVKRGDTLYVPKAGVVYVEGAVKKPGAYPLTGAATVLKAVTLAGGLESTARKSGVQVLRAGSASTETVSVDFAEIRHNPSADVAVHDGDVVVVSSNPVKTVLLGFWRGVSGLVNVSKGF
jgi:polysaccharide export outer membrane protein